MRRARTRRILKWVGLAASVPLLAAWTVLPSSTFTLFGSPAIRLERGLAMPHRVFTIVHIDGPEYRLGCINLPKFMHVAVPFWLAFVPVAVPTAILWYRDRRPPKGHCQNCGYDLTGNVSGVCAECGEALSRRA